MQLHGKVRDGGKNALFFVITKVDEIPQSVQVIREYIKHRQSQSLGDSSTFKDQERRSCNKGG